MTTWNALGEAVIFGFQKLAQYHALVERAVEESQEKLSQKIAETLGSIPLETLNPVFAIEFPRYLRYSMVLLLHTLVEVQCENLYHILKTQGAKGSGKTWIERTKSTLQGWLKRRGVPNAKTQSEAIGKLWKDLEFLEALRHCIAHEDGDVSHARAELRSFDKDRWKGIKIEDSRVWLQKEFFAVAIERAKNVFAHVLAFSNELTQM